MRSGKICGKNCTRVANLVIPKMACDSASASACARASAPVHNARALLARTVTLISSC